MKTYWFRWTLVLQLLVFIGWIGLEERKRIPVATVLLETVPVDPRDLWSGQYLMLSYRVGVIHTLPGFPKKRPAGPFTVAVRLMPGADTAAGRNPARTIWRAVECREGGLPDEPPAEGVWVAGTWGRTGRIVEYGIERYYFSQSRTVDMRRLSTGRFFVECAVSRDGRLTIRKIVE